MKMTDTYPGYRCHIEIISHAVWLYFRFTLSFRDVEEILAYGGKTPVARMRLSKDSSTSYN